MRRIVRECKGTMRPGQDLIVAGYTGAKGAAIIAAEKRLELKQRFSENYIDNIINDANQNQIEIANVEFLSKLGVTESEEAIEGGILTALWNLSGAYCLGIRFHLRKILIKQTTIEVCEFYGLNPYRLLSENCYLLVSDHGYDCIERLSEYGLEGAVIGKVENGIGREMVRLDGVGFLERPRTDEIKKVMPYYLTKKKAGGNL